jgi:fatty-acyl-CoA synthase
MSTSAAVSPTALASYTSATSDTPLLGDTIGANLERTVARWGDREALVDVPTHRRWTYSELDVEVDELALGLLELGVDQGDRVGIWSPNCAEWVLLQFATAKIGAILVNVNPSYRSHELAFAVNQSGMRLLVSATAHKTSDYRAMVEQVRGDCPALDEVVYIG